MQNKIKEHDYRHLKEETESEEVYIGIPVPTAPFLAAPVAPFESSTQRVAETAATYYGECFVEGIPPKEADDAAQESLAHFQNWWLQARFKSNGNETDQNGTSAPLLQQQHPCQGATDIVHSSVHASSKRQKCNLFSETLSFNNSIATEIHVVENRKMSMLDALADAHGETNSPKFLKAVDELVQAHKRLHSLYKGSTFDVRKDPCDGTAHPLEGIWLTVSKPNYSECLGQNSDGEYMYTLGRMSFDMFRPTSLRCSIQGLFNPVFITDHTPDIIPRNLIKDVQENKSTLRTYNIVVAFTIQSTDSNAPPLHGVMTNYGYTLPDPNVPNRFTIFFTGGLLEPNDETDLKEWKKTFGADAPKRSLADRARLLAAKILLGATVSDTMEADGSMSYYLKRPIGAHGSTYMDVLYVDETVRVMKGHTGCFYVFTRVPPQHVLQD